MSRSLADAAAIPCTAGDISCSTLSKAKHTRRAGQSMVSVRLSLHGRCQSHSQPQPRLTTAARLRSSSSQQQPPTRSLRRQTSHKHSRRTVVRAVVVVTTQTQAVDAVNCCDPSLTAPCAVTSYRAMTTSSRLLLLLLLLFRSG